MSAITKLRHHRELGVELLLKGFANATPETRDKILARWDIWYRGLLRLVEPLGDGVAARFEPLTPMLPEEQATVARCQPLDEHFNMIRACHAVCMYRLGEVFKKFDPVLPKDDAVTTLPPKTARPKRKPGQRPLDPPKRIEAVQAALDEQTRMQWPSNIQGAIKGVLDEEGLNEDEDPNVYTNAFERLKKRRWRCS